MSVVSKIKRLAEPMRAAMLAMAILATVLIFLFTADVYITIGIAICAVLYYVLPALIVDNMGKAHMDAAVASSIVIAAISVAEAYLIRAGWSLVMVAAAFPPLVAGLVINLTCPTLRSTELAIDIAMFGFFVLIPTVVVFVEHNIIFLLLIDFTVISYLAYIYLFIDDSKEEGCGRGL